MEELFLYTKTTEDDVRLYGCIPDTIKITGINSADENGDIIIPEQINGVPVTCYDVSYFGEVVNNLYIPRTLTVITGIDSLPAVKDKVIVDENNSAWKTDGICLYSKDGTKLFKMVKKELESYVVPDGVNIIGTYAFKFNKIAELTIPDSVETVKNGAFYACYTLKTVHGAQGIKEYSSSSFSDTEWYRNAKNLRLGKTLVRYGEDAEEVIVADGIEIIGEKAFSSNKTIKSIVLPTTIRIIENYAFSYMDNLSSIIIPEGLEKIGDSAFCRCKSLKDIKLPESLKALGREAFTKCISLESVCLPKAVAGFKTSLIKESEPSENVLSEGLFSGCETLKLFSVPDGIEYIGDKAFEICSSMEKIILPETIKTMGDGVFQGCYQLETIYIPTALETLGDDVFPSSVLDRWVSYYSRLKEIQVSEDNKKYKSQAGILFSKDGKTIIKCPASLDEKDYVIPDRVEKINQGAFEGNSKIRRILFAQSVKNIGDHAFASMASLEEIILPEDMPVLGKALFDHCEKLRMITWPKNLKEIGVHCFSNTGIESLDLPETVETIDSYAFEFIKAKSVVLPKTVKEIGISVFAGIPNIEVYDTIDSNAKPASIAVDANNGSLNGRIGFIGIHQRENYLIAAVNADWYDHTITVRSASDDLIKYVVYMPSGQKRKVYCTFASSWGKNAEFSFEATDALFGDLTGDAKLAYALNRIKWDKVVPENMMELFAKTIKRKAKDVSQLIFNDDEPERLTELEPFGIVDQKTIEGRIEDANKAGATKCVAWLLNWKNTHVSKKNSK